MASWRFGVTVAGLGMVHACSSGAGDESPASHERDAAPRANADGEVAISGDAGSNGGESEGGDPEPTMVEHDAASTEPIEPLPDPTSADGNDAGMPLPPEQEPMADPPGERVHGSIVYLGWLDPVNTALRGFFYHDLSLPDSQLLHEDTSSGEIDCAQDGSVCVFSTRQFEGLAWDELHVARLAPQTSPQVTTLLAPEGTRDSDPLSGVTNIVHAEVNHDGSKVLATFFTGEQLHAGIFHLSAAQAPEFESLGLSESDLDSVSVFCTTPDFEKIVLGVADGPRRILVVDTTEPTPLIWDAGELHRDAVGFELTRDCRHALYSSSSSVLGIEYANLTEPDLMRQSLDGGAHWLSADQTRVAYYTQGIAVATLGDGMLEPVKVPPPDLYTATNMGTKVDFSLDSQQLAVRGEELSLADNSVNRLWWIDLSEDAPAAPLDVSSSGPQGPVEVEDFYFAHDGQALLFSAADGQGEFIVSVADGEVGTPSALFPTVPDELIVADYPRLPESHFPLRVIEDPTTNEKFLQLVRVEQGAVTGQYEELRGSFLSVTPTWHGATVLVASRGKEEGAPMRIYRLDLDGESPALNLLAEHPGANDAGDLQLSRDRSAAFYAVVYPEGYEHYVAFAGPAPVLAGGEEVMALQAFLY